MTTTEKRHKAQLVSGGPDGRKYVVGVDCSCGWAVRAPEGESYLLGFHDWDEHMRAEGLCPRCQNIGTYVVENGRNRYRRVCRCKAGRALFRLND